MKSYSVGKTSKRCRADDVAEYDFDSDVPPMSIA